MSWNYRVVRRAAGRPKAGDHVVDGGMAGTLVRCHECGGGGLLLRPDPEELETLRAAPKDEAGATEPAPARSEFRAADLLRQAIADRLGYDRDADWPSDDVMIRALAEAGAPAEPTGDIDRDAS